MTLFDLPYTAHSYVDYVVGQGGITTGTTAFPFSKHALRTDHIKVYYKSVASLQTWTLQASSKYTISGSTGAYTVTINGTFPARTDGDWIRIVRETPDTKVGRLVDFQAGSLAEADLDSSALQNLYIAEERRDQIMAVTAALQTLIPTIFGGSYTWESV